MQVDIQLDPKVIEQSITKAIIDSALGDALKTEIERQLRELTGKYWDNALEKMVREEMVMVIRRILDEDGNREKIREVIAAKLEDTMLDEIVARLWDRVLND